MAITPLEGIAAMSEEQRKPAKRRWKRKARGNPPHGDEWFIAAAFSGDRIEWLLHVKGEANGKGWVMVKLRAKGWAVKANYWLGWCDKEARFARTEEAKRLELERPELFRQVWRWLVDNRLSDAADLL